MKTFIFFSSIVLLLSIDIEAQEIEKKPKNYLAWCRMISPPITQQGRIFSLTDTSIIFIRSTKYEPNTDYTNYDYIIIPYHKIKYVITRKDNSVGKGILIGGLTGAGTGLIAGLLASISHEEETHTPYDDGNNYEGMGVFLATASGAILGITIGMIVGSVKTLIKINGDKERFTTVKPKLNKYAIKPN